MFSPRTKKADELAERRLVTKNPQLRFIDRLTQKIASEYRRGTADLERLQVNNEGKAEAFSADFLEKATIFIKEELTYSAPVVEHDADIPAAGHCWLLKSCVGVHNFTHGTDNYHLLFVYLHNGSPVFAATYQPLHDELTYVIKGSGFVTNRKARVSGRKQLTDARVSFSPRTFDDKAVKHLSNLQKDLPELSVVTSNNAVADIIALCNGQLDVALWRGLSLPSKLFAELAIAESGGKYAPLSSDDSFVLGTSITLWDAVNKKLA